MEATGRPEVQSKDVWIVAFLARTYELNRGWKRRIYGLNHHKVSQNQLISAHFGSFSQRFLVCRSLGVESRAHRKPMQALRLLLKFRDTVSVAVGRGQGGSGGSLCWCQGQRMAALFDFPALSCAEEAQKELQKLASRVLMGLR